MRRRRTLAVLAEPGVAAEGSGPPDPGSRGPSATSGRPPRGPQRGGPQESQKPHLHGSHRLAMESNGEPRGLGLRNEPDGPSERPRRRQHGLSVLPLHPPVPVVLLREQAQRSDGGGRPGEGSLPRGEERGRMRLRQPFRPPRSPPARRQTPV